MNDYPINEGMKKLEFLIGEWEAKATHRLLPGQALEAKVTFEWLKPSGLIVMLSEFVQADIPKTVSVFAWDDTFDTYTMLAYDSRGVSRRYEMSLEDKTWKMHRDAKEFKQRFIWKINDGQTEITSMAELSENDQPWVNDMEIVYKKIN